MSRPAAILPQHPPVSLSGVACRILSAVPLSRQIVPIMGAYACLWLLFSAAAQVSPVPSGWGTGLAVFVLLFLQLRLVDDLDDRGRDRRHGRGGPPLAVQLATLAGIVAALALLGLGHPSTLAAETVATLAAYAAPFGFKRLFPASLAVGSLFFEAAPALIFAAAYAAWSDATGTALPPAIVVPAIVLFWAGYEMWKFSRKVHADAMQPYFLAPQGIRACLAFFLLVAASAAAALAHEGAASFGFALYVLAVVAVVLVWMNATWTASRPRPLWSGMGFVLAIECGLLAELAPHFGG